MGRLRAAFMVLKQETTHVWIRTLGTSHYLGDSADYLWPEIGSGIGNAIRNFKNGVAEVEIEEPDKIEAK